MTNKYPMANLPRRTLPTAAPEMIIYPWTVMDDRPEVDGTCHFHWTIQAFQDKDGTTLNDVVVVEVEALSEQLAIARAMTVLQRNYYRVMQVREACSADKDVKGG